MIVVDTNVLSEFMRPSPDERVAAWLTGIDSDQLGITAITFMEITYGIARLPAGRRKSATSEVWSTLQTAWTGAVLVLGQAESVAAGEALARRAAIGRPLTAPDAQIAGICLVHGASLATRNVRDFEGLGIDLIDPWAA